MGQTLENTPGYYSNCKMRNRATDGTNLRHSNYSWTFKLLILTMLGCLLSAETVQANQIARLLQDDQDTEGDDQNNQILDGADQSPSQDEQGDDSGFKQEQSNESKEQSNKKAQEEEDAAQKEALKKKQHRTQANVHKDDLNEYQIQDIQERYAKGTYRLTIESIVPRGGPTYGTTRVLVRMDNLSPLIDAYPNPKCKFGKNSMIVEAAYIKCTKKPIGFYEKEKGKDAASLDDTCIQCEQSPKSKVDDIISFTVSLSGNFDDAESSMPYRYYKSLNVKSIYPRYGPKDGDTVIQVWGENFLDLGDDFRCNFGTKSTKAHFINSEYIWCRTPQSDVVERPMPFSVSLNRQQNSMEKLEYWYYNMQSLFGLNIDYGPIQGGQKIILKGQSLLPFDWKLDIDNQNDTFCAFGPLGKTPAHIISSTSAECLTPENHLGLMQVPIKLTLNNQNYTDEEVQFTYFNPPNVVDAEPLIGPVGGGTVVNFWGNKFEHKNIVCKFGKIEVQGKYVSKEHLTCTAPQTLEPGDYKLIVKYDKDRFQSDVLTYTYFSNPEVLSMEPACGPIEGYTQITVRGKNFIEQGFGKAKCVFNNTQQMNATVLDSNTIVCDSPILDSQNGDMWYNVSVTLDGDYISNAGAKFKYYHNPKIDSISPWLGPMVGGTNSTIRGSGFNQTNICNLKVRYEQTHLIASDVTATSLNALSPPANISTSVIVSISGNNQQFINDYTLHFRDRQNTFEYYQPFIVESINPAYLSNAGNSPLSIQGMLFDQFKYDNGTKKDVTMKCRFVDTSNNNVIGAQSSMKKVSQGKQVCIAPKTDFTGDARVELSVNDQQWQDSSQVVKFYNGPRVTAVSPTYGVTKNPRGLKLEISGENFQCPNNDCSRIKVRFTNDKGDKIHEDGKMSDSGNIVCKIPKYPAPETLDVDVSFNDQDFTNNGVKFGFMDPFILGLKPRLISTHGTTQVNMTGYGFVQMEETKSVVVMKNNDKTLNCGQGTICTKNYKVTDEHNANVGTFEQSVVSTDSKNLGFETWNINMMNPDGDFTPNGIDLWYYQDLQFNNVSSQFAYSNEEKPIIINTDFFWGKGNKFNLFRKYATFTCRFTGTNSDQPKQLVVPAIMESSPIGAYNKDTLPDQIRCRTPKWNISDTTTLEISVNGQDYMGNYQYTFVDSLEIYRISPLSGPIGGNTKVKFYGSGFMSSIPKTTELFIKFGVADSQSLDKSLIQDYTWNEEEYYKEMNLQKIALRESGLNDKTLEDAATVKTYISAVSPDVSKYFQVGTPDILGSGGPVYVQVGEKVPIREIDHSSAKKGDIIDHIDTVYPDSSNLEFYFYRQPFVKKIEPTSGLASGGTMLSITGGWFMQKPEYGVFPFCRIGSQVIKAKYIQSNRIICKTPPSYDTGAPSQVAVSLNGVDFYDTGFTFSYYEKPVIIDIQPRSGSVEGGTEIWMKGLKFSNITHGMKTVRCRFRQIMPTNATDGEQTIFDEDNVPTKFIPAYYIDKETMKCASPSGWIGGDQVKVDLTFNGVDYTDNSFVFSFYNIFGSFPKSGPADATSQFIQIRGKGFRKESTILCSLNNVEVAPIQIKPNVIKCPMVLENWPGDKYESVNFHILIDGSKHDFGNFHYYKQIIIENVNPLLGPNEGHGAIYFLGRNFRTDFENSRLGCRIGNTIGQAQLIDSETVRCTLSHKLPLLDEGQSLPVSIALNSYSWAPSEFSFTPYGISDIYPSSGPTDQNTNILVVGSGFANDLQDEARCKFGTDDNYIIVEAQVLDNEHMICKSPSEDITLPEGASSEITVPFSIAFQEDMYYPFTEGPIKYRLYKHPLTTDIYPSQAQVTRLTEVYVSADESNGFNQPKPSVGHNVIEQDQYGMKCKFGRFGTSAATYVNRTTILCLTPNILDDPSDICEETVLVTISMNGVDFNEDSSEIEFTFQGTGGSISTWVIIMGTLIFGLLIVSVLIFLAGLKDFMRQRSNETNQLQSYTQTREGGGQQLRNVSRASSANLGSRAFNPSRRTGGPGGGGAPGSRAGRISASSRGAGGGGFRFGSNNPNQDGGSRQD